MLDPFFDALISIRGVSNAEILVDKEPENVSHNRAAALLRHGLAVTVFASLEQFLKQSFRSSMQVISGCSIDYAAMSEKFKNFVVVDALDGLINEGQRDKVTRLQLLQDNIVEIAGGFSSPATYTAWGFSPKGSNISADDIGGALKALGVDDPWKWLTSKTSEIGAARLDLCTDYKNLAKTRHGSAHNPTRPITNSDLISHIDVAVLVGILVKAILTDVALAYASSATVQKLSQVVKQPAVKFRFVDKVDAKKYAERPRTDGPSIKNYNSFAGAVAAAQQRNRGASIVIRDERRIPIGLL